MATTIDLLSSSLVSSIRGWNGISSTPSRNKPEKLLRLYNRENCPYCRLVREVITELDLDVLILSCPKGGKRFRAECVEIGGKAQFPFLIDKDLGIDLYESKDIIDYLFKTYGEGKVPIRWKFSNLQKINSIVASSVRNRQNRGQSTPTTLPKELLELYSFEASPYARPVRELLCQLELPFIIRSCGRTELSEWVLPSIRKKMGIKPESKVENRIEIMEKMGEMRIPFLYDPNTGKELFESSEIMEYIERQYVSA